MSDKELRLELLQRASYISGTIHDQVNAYLVPLVHVNVFWGDYPEDDEVSPDHIVKENS